MRTHGNLEYPWRLRAVVSYSRAYPLNGIIITLKPTSLQHKESSTLCQVHVGPYFLTWAVVKEMEGKQTSTNYFFLLTTPCCNSDVPIYQATAHDVTDMKKPLQNLLLHGK